MKEEFPKTKSTLDKMFEIEEKTPYELIVCKCFDCCGYNPFECKSLTTEDFNEAVDSIKHCETGKCVLAGYARHIKSFPKKTKKKKEYTEEQKAAMRERMLKARQVMIERINNKNN